MPTNNPLRCSYAGIAATTAFAGNKVVLLNTGNYPADSSFLNFTEKWSGTDWSRPISALGSGPLPTRIDMAMCYDGYNALMYGGKGETGVLGDTWTVGNASVSWTKEAPPTSPFARYKAKLALLNVAAPKAIMFGGCNENNVLDETWQWDGNLKTWTLLAPAAKPAARTDFMFSGGNSNCVLFGGLGTNEMFGDTWSFNGTTWTQNTPTTPPSARYGGCLTYDPANNLWVLFGGANNSDVLPSETWTLNAGRTAWTKRAPANNPPGRVGAMMVYDIQSSRVILTGGTNGYDVVYNDTWSFNTTTFEWTQL
jgi:hypothetical protein